MIIRVPTKLTDRQIEEYQKIYKEKYGKEISKEEAIREGLRLIRLVAVVIDKSR